MEKEPRDPGRPSRFGGTSSAGPPSPCTTHLSSFSVHCIRSQEHLDLVCIYVPCCKSYTFSPRGEEEREPVNSKGRGKGAASCCTKHVLLLHKLVGSDWAEYAPRSRPQSTGSGHRMRCTLEAVTYGGDAGPYSHSSWGRKGRCPGQHGVDWVALGSWKHFLLLASRFILLFPLASFQASSAGFSSS